MCQGPRLVKAHTVQGCSKPEALGIHQCEAFLGKAPTGDDAVAEHDGGHTRGSSVEANVEDLLDGYGPGLVAVDGHDQPWDLDQQVQHQCKQVEPQDVLRDSQAVRLSACCTP